MPFTSTVESLIVNWAPKLSRQEIVAFMSSEKYTLVISLMPFSTNEAAIKARCPSDFELGALIIPQYSFLAVSLIS